ncbi:serine hydrolase domain-containing protein [Massilia sp. LjRoot122]|uniref:serine hydrolase domain-containing protein n=1 Tax=Massilia sp. LjRoot122 TaxID=3342257 RepID=UPI003ECDC622
MNTSLYPFVAAILLAVAAPSHADQVDDYMRRQMALNHVPGAAVAVVRDGRIVKLGTYGLANLEWRQRVTPDTAFQLASSTKPFTGLLLMRLQEAGRLSLDDSVAKYLPEAPQAWRPITLRHLADHSAGIPDDVKVGPDATLDEYVAAAAALPLAHAPGASASYGIAGYTVLAKLIETAAGMPYPEALKHYVTGPLGLRADFDYSSGDPNMRSLEVVPKRAGVYDWSAGRHREFRFHFSPFSYVAGGLLASAQDLAKVAIALDKGSFLRRQSLDAMWTPSRLGNGESNGFALGWTVRDVNGRTAVGHSGGPALSDILHFPGERATFIVLTNGKKLYPYLAQGLSELFYPPPPVVMPAGIADSRPELSALLRRTLAEAAAGKVGEEHFSERARKDFVPAFKDFLLPFVRSLPAVDEFVLLAESPRDGGIRRTYRARHGQRAQTWGFDVDKDGKLLGFGPK